MAGTIPYMAPEQIQACILSFISVVSQVQLRELSYTCVQYIKKEALATASSKVQRN
jgi:hypothetical protein